MKHGRTLGLFALGMMASAAVAQNTPHNMGDNIAGGGAEQNTTIDQNAGDASNATTGSDSNGMTGSYTGTNSGYNATTRLNGDVPKCSARIRDNCMETSRNR
jgi:hypothetical protein